MNTLKGARIKRVENFLDRDINMVTYGDGVANINIKALIDFHKSHGKMVTVTAVRPSARFGELVERDGKVVSFQEKPQTSFGLINGGFMVFNKNMYLLGGIDNSTTYMNDVWSSSEGKTWTQITDNATWPKR